MSPTLLTEKAATSRGSSAGRPARPTGAVGPLRQGHPGDLRWGLGRRCAGEPIAPPTLTESGFPEMRPGFLLLVLSLHPGSCRTASGCGTALGGAWAAALAEVAGGASLGYAGSGIQAVRMEGAWCLIPTPGTRALAFSRCSGGTQPINH